MENHDIPPPRSRVAVLLPCLNEEMTVAGVVKAFQAALPEAEIWVFDNDSSDTTALRAQEAGAHLFHEPRRGKGYVVQSMFRHVEADVYVMADGDGTYPADEAGAMIEPVVHGRADMVVGTRLLHESESEFRAINRLGNRLFLWIFSRLFRVRITDLLSGYRAFSAEFVRGIPLFGGGFEIDAELTIKALQKGFRVVEVPVRLVGRPAGSRSKIRLFRDGIVILNGMLTLARDYKPLTIFGGAGASLILASAVLATAAVVGTPEAGATARGSWLVATAVVFLLGMSSIFTGLILHTVARHFQELDFVVRREADGRKAR